MLCNSRSFLELRGENTQNEEGSGGDNTACVKFSNSASSTFRSHCGSIILPNKIAIAHDTGCSRQKPLYYLSLYRSSKPSGVLGLGADPERDVKTWYTRTQVSSLIDSTNQFANGRTFQAVLRRGENTSLLPEIFRDHTRLSQQPGVDRS